MRRDKTARAFALYEVLIGLTIFVVGVLALGRAVENCMNASALSEQEERVRQILANRMAEVQATPGQPDTSKENKLETGFGQVKLTQKAAAAGLKNEKDVELSGLNLVTLTAEWERHGVQQSRKIEFYVYRSG
ncbi:MAG: type IV pilus modification PilV family protein [Chthoniobacterales bacterium]